jgi:hypothetical protein
MATSANTHSACEPIRPAPAENSPDDDRTTVQDGAFLVKNQDVNTCMAALRPRLLRYSGNSRKAFDLSGFHQFRCGVSPS